MTNDPTGEPTATRASTYVLVMLQRCRAPDDHSVDAAHEQFITNLITRNMILLGGGFGESIGAAEAAYVLRCRIADASAIADADPLVASGAMRAQCVEWHLVGINPDAIEASTIIRPESSRQT